MSKFFIIGLIIVLIMIVALAAIEGLIISLLWNWLAPMFWASAPILNMWQAFGLLVLINIIGRLLFNQK